jgi:hypothetical protein
VDDTNIPLKQGIYCGGIVIHQSAKLIPRKDGPGHLVKARYELAMRGSVAIFHPAFDPNKDSCVKVKNGEVIEFPLFPHCKPIVLFTGPDHFSIFRGRIYISKAERFL